MTADPFALEVEADLLRYDQPGRYGYLRRLVAAEAMGHEIAVVDPESRICVRHRIPWQAWEDPDVRTCAYEACEDELLHYLDVVRSTYARAKMTGSLRIRLLGGVANGREFEVPTDRNGSPPWCWRVVRPRSMDSFWDADPVVSVIPEDVSYYAGPLPCSDGVWPYREAW